MGQISSKLYYSLLENDENLFRKFFFGKLNILTTPLLYHLLSSIAAAALQRSSELNKQLEMTP